MTDLIDSETLEIRRGWKGYYLSCFIAYFGVITLTFILSSHRQDSIDFFFKNWTLVKIPFILIILVIPFLCLFYYFDKRVKIRIGPKGIWTKKHGDIPWTEVWYFHSTIRQVKDGHFYRLRFKLKDTLERYDKEIVIKYWRMDMNFDKVRKLVAAHCSKHGIDDLGHAYA